MRLFIALCIGMLMAGCGSGSDSLSGNGSETGNPRVAGVAYEKSGAPAIQGKVTICKANYSPFGSDSVYATTTDSFGRFERELPDTGTYTVLLLSSDSSRGIATSCHAAAYNELGLGPLTLEPTRTLVAHRSSHPQAQNLYAAGTPFKLHFAASGDSTAIFHVPVGSYRFFDSQTNEAAAEITIVSGDPPTVTLNILPTILVIAPEGGDSSTGSVAQIIECADSSICHLRIAQAAEAQAILATNTTIHGIVLLNGSEQSTALVQILDTISLPILVSSSSWFPFLHMTEDTGIGMASAASFLIDGSTMGKHPIIASMGLTVIASLAAVESPVLLSWGKPAGAAEVIAYGIGDQSQKFIFTYEAADSMVRMSAPARRVGLPFGNGTLSTTGRTILSNALAWFYQ